MKLKDIIHETYASLLSNKIRTGLTMLGIIIGIGSVIAMVSIGQGAQGTIESNIQSLGSNLIQVMPGVSGGVGSQISQGRGSAQTLTYEDAISIRDEIASVSNLSAELQGRYQIVGKGTNTNTSVVGTLPSYPDVRNVVIADGSFITDQHISNLSKVAVLGSIVRDDLFGEEYSPVGENIRINGIQFKIIGITEPKGGSNFGSQDNMVFIPLTTSQKILSGSNYLSTISIQISQSKLMAQAQEEITNLLLIRHKITDPQRADFNIINQNDIVETASSVTKTFTLLLGSVAGISLLVGGIGIMNMMLTTVTERTREIGLKKAIGAKRRDINLQFLVEAVIITLIGGLIGVLLGFLVSVLMNSLGILQTSVSLNSVLLAFGVSATIGIIFGYYPARKASLLNPIDALRYE